VWLLFCLSIVVQMGMWMERFLIVVSSLHRDFLPSSWGMFYPTGWDWTHLFGSIGFFFLLFLLFVRFLPAISISEVREQLHEQQEAQ
jgi:molybdopterin-containing oxidoreductase family membrane subunit